MFFLLSYAVLYNKFHLGKQHFPGGGNEVLFYSQGILNPPISLVHLTRDTKLYKETEGGALLLRILAASVSLFCFKD